MPEKARTEIWNTDTTLDEDGIHRKGLNANETIQATLCNGSTQHGEYDKTLPLSDLWMWLQLMCPIKAIRRIRPNPANGRSMDVAATRVAAV
jgi:hypothetical protein